MRRILIGGLDICWRLLGDGHRLPFSREGDFFCDTNSSRFQCSNKTRSSEGYVSAWFSFRCFGATLGQHHAKGQKLARPNRWCCESFNTRR